MPPNWTSDADRTYAQLMTQARVDETYIKVKGAWKYLYRAVDVSWKYLGIHVEC